MRIKLRLLATLERYLPSNADGNLAEIDVPEGTTPAQVIERLGIPKVEWALVMIDGFHQLPSELSSRPLKDGETLAIAPPIAGG